MAKLKYVNKATGKEYSGDAKDVARLKAHPQLGHLYSFEAEVETPKDPKQTKEQAPASTGDEKK